MQNVYAKSFTKANFGNWDLNWIMTILETWKVNRSINFGVIGSE